MSCLVPTLNQTYTGKGSNAKRRLKDKNHSQRDLIDHPDSEITIYEVDLGTASTSRERSRALGVAEQDVMDAAENIPKSIRADGVEVMNKQKALRPEKQEKYRVDYQPNITNTREI